MRKRRYDRYVSTTESLLGTHRCDLTSLAETERLVEVMRRDLPTLDYLVLSQGIFSTAGRTETSESHDVKMVLHYYSRMAIIRGLQKNLEQSQALLAQAKNLRQQRVARLASMGQSRFEDSIYGTKGCQPCQVFDRYRFPGRTF